MKLEGYNPDWCFSHPDRNEYERRWAAQYPNASANDLVLHYVYDHSPFTELISPDKEQV